MPRGRSTTPPTTAGALRTEGSGTGRRRTHHTAVDGGSPLARGWSSAPDRLGGALEPFPTCVGMDLDGPGSASARSPVPVSVWSPARWRVVSPPPRGCWRPVRVCAADQPDVPPDVRRPRATRAICQCRRRGHRAISPPCPPAHRSPRRVHRVRQALGGGQRSVRRVHRRLPPIPVVRSLSDRRWRPLPALRCRTRRRAGRGRTPATPGPCGSRECCGRPSDLGGNLDAVNGEVPLPPDPGSLPTSGLSRQVVRGLPEGSDHQQVEIAPGEQHVVERSSKRRCSVGCSTTAPTSTPWRRTTERSGASRALPRSGRAVSACVRVVRDRRLCREGRRLGRSRGR